MVGGSIRRDEGSFTISNTNVFSALESLRKKKKSDKVKKSKTSSKAPSKEPEPQVFWAPTPLNAKSWADVDDEDDDDFYATTAPPQNVWRVQEPEQSMSSSAAVEEVSKIKSSIAYAMLEECCALVIGGSIDAARNYLVSLRLKQQDELYNVVPLALQRHLHANGKVEYQQLQESESEDDMIDLGDDDVEEDHEHEEVVHPESVVQKVPEALAPLPAKENERQLSKKERKKKELEELEALLADFGVAQKDGDAPEKKDSELKKEQASDNGDKKDAVPSESKNAKKKKKKDKASKENQANSSDANGHPKDPTETEQADEDPSAVDVKERLKKVAAAKKKKSGKELDGAAKAAAHEAAARNAKLAAAKKKEKNHHYNQQPVR